LSGIFAVGVVFLRNRYVATGLDLLPQTVAPILFGLGLGFCLGLAGLNFFGLWALYAGLAVGTLLVAGCIPPRLVWKKMRNPIDVEPCETGEDIPAVS
jgi:hypothetical protein